VKRRIYAEYRVDPRSQMPGEIDHFFPLCAGGSNDITNLWFQPETNVWNGKTTASVRKTTLRRDMPTTQGWRTRREKRI
jgi:hypothetical protein